MPEAVTPEPVFVDPAGRRMRWIRRTLWALVVLAVAYVALAISAFLGGPSIDAPLLPQPRAAVAPPAPTTVPKTADAVPVEPSADPVDVPGEQADTADPAPASVPSAPPAPSTAPAPAPEPTETAPGSSGTAPGQNRSRETPGDTRKADPTPKPRAS
ncbi:hypothetical protein DY023_13745 [Microbacterium bovistercoris]|uniref:Uncharacterized protein n=1 Tax=Microbacterium bovistercoris TaxID=2293570 RepID=A0A371NRX1_9MICO|nr:hypothetical protein [Microbacterium bovistercoris]REJ04507.1 hypothetical protein DY023_13745 [Microbacterium bovistercoris]